MAELIVEVRDARGRLASRHIVASSQLRVGRALDNDIVVDDPHIDAHHAVLDFDSNADAVGVSDLGSVNGTRLGRRHASVEGDLWPLGQPIEIGRSTLTVFSAAAPVPAAVPLQSKLVRGVSASRLRSLALSGGAGLYFFASLFLTDYEDAGWVSWAGGALAIVVFLYVWAGGWSAGAKLASKPAAFLAHLGWVSAFVLVAMPLGLATSYAGYLFPDSSVVAGIGWAVSGWLVATVLLFGHLELVSRRSTRFKLMVSGGGIAVLIGLGVLATAAEDDHMAPVSGSLGTLRWMPVAAVPTRSVEDFAAELEDLQAELDRDALEVPLQ